MTMPSDDRMDADLDALLKAARRTGPPEETARDAAFMARVLADALAVQAEQQAARPAFAAPAPRRRGWWARAAAALGGAAVVAGLGSAAMAGLLIGYVQPEPVVSLAGTIGLGTSESLSLLPDLETILTEDVTQ